MKKNLFKEYPERVLGALVLFVRGVVVLTAFLSGALGYRHIPAKESFAGDKTSVILNINTASEEELKQLDGVSDVIAKRIVLYREENGKFGTVEDLMKVEGIGEKKLQSIRNYVTAE